MNHFHFGSSNAVATVSFYEKYFGFREIKRLGPTHVLRDDNNFILAIDEIAGAEPIPNCAHLGFTLTDPDVVEELHVTMSADQVPLPGELQRPSTRATHFYCQDPSGNRIEVGWYSW